VVRPRAGRRKPSMGAAKPSSSVVRPRAGRRKPSMGAAKPSSSDRSGEAIVAAVFANLFSFAGGRAVGGKIERELYGTAWSRFLLWGAGHNGATRDGLGGLRGTGLNAIGRTLEMMAQTERVMIPPASPRI
jgi:hypothetical protein